MASKKPGSPLRSVSPLRSLPAAVEWVGGTFTLPGPVTDGARLVRPEGAAWLSPEGPLSMVLGHQDEGGASCLLEAFAQATTRPMRGEPGRPDRVRVASAELAAWLRPRLGDDVAVVCAPTPEFDLMIASLGEFLAAQRPPARDPSFLDHGSTADQVAALFRAAAALFRTSPWKVIPSDASALSFTCEPLGLRGAAVSVIGQLGESVGFLCFDSMDDFEHYLDGASQSAGGGGLPVDLPPHIALNLEPGAELDPALRKEVSKHRWEVAAASAYPSIYALGESLSLRPLTRQEVLRLEVICLALAGLVRSAAPGLRGAWGEGGPLEATLTVASSDGPLEVTIRAPHEDDVGLDVDPLSEERDASGALDLDWYDAHRDFLLDAFGQSPEAAALGHGGLAPLFLDLAAQHLDATVLGLTTEHVAHLLFDLLPRKVSAPPEIAPDIVGEFRALLSFARRAFGLDHLDACLRSLTAATSRRLAREMTSPRHTSLVKSMLMAGQAAGFDLSTPEGLEAWMRVASASPLAVPPPRPGAPRKPGAAKKPASKPPARKASGKAAAGKAAAGKASAGKASAGKAAGKASAGKASGARKGPGKSR